MQSICFRLDSLGDKHELKRIKRELDRIPGVHSVAVNLQKDTISVDFDHTAIPSERIAQRIENLGYSVEQHELTN